MTVKSVKKGSALGAEAVAAVAAAAAAPKPVQAVSVTPEKPYVGNLVLYRLEGKDANGHPVRKALRSCDADDEMAGLLMQQGAADEIRAAHHAGTAVPVLHLIHEYREANAEKVITKSAFQRINPLTLEPVGSPVANLEDC